MNHDLPMTQELRYALRPLRHWWWALLIVPLISAAIGYVAIQRATTYYQARTMLGIGPDFAKVESGAPDVVHSINYYGSIYANVAESDQFLALVARQSGTNLGLEQLKSAIVAYFRPYTPYLEIQIVDSDKQRALTVLNAMNQLLMQSTPQVDKLKRDTQQVFLAQQRQALVKIVEDNKAQIAQLNTQLISQANGANNDTLVTKVQNLQDDIEARQVELDELDELVNKYELNQIRLVDEPELVNVKLGPQPVAAAIALGAIGLVLVLTVIFLVNKAESRIRSQTQLENLTGLKVLAGNSPKAKKQPELSYDLLAADLIAVGENIKPRLLVLHEFYLSQTAEPLNLLASALERLGVTVTVQQGERAKQTALQLLSQSKTATTLLEKEQSDWEIIEQNWPTNLDYLERLAAECTGIIVLCSLKGSYKQDLLEMSAFVKHQNCTVKGLVPVN